ncbi:MAG: gamma-glutamyl-gamma-aminobutyrate hydrolase family protein [Chloroflexaceae bacterium]|nr:gamma-glutamyl-gamma-aminobutyrate hydrolase family protein [Chloroflexaceae bacterium]NJO07839.1 gamma-glutamyl-gamma-aminobutyrate hydrolase family protein [Chloroflexaceae bacterium]
MNYGSEAARPPVFIGITTQSRDEQTERFALRMLYVDAVRAVGGVPVLLPPGETHLERLFSRLDGLILSGGGDIDPTHYGQPRHPTNYLIDRERDTFEIHLAHLAVQHQLPTLGICRGAQILGVAHGSALVPHIPDVFQGNVQHWGRIEGEHLVFTEHPVAVEPDSRLGEAIGVPTFVVPSLHHQAVQQVPAGWRVAARAADGVIESFEHCTHPWMVAVQWHPEAAYTYEPQCRLFTALAQAARQHRHGRN